MIVGEPGIDKSHVLQAAFQWFAFQCNASQLLLVAAYMWQATRNIVSTHYTTSTSINMQGLQIWPLCVVVIRLPVPL